MFVFAADCPSETLKNGAKRTIKGHIGDLMVVELVWQKGMTSTQHAHEHRQCCYVVRGSFRMQLNGESRILRAGDCLYAEANVPHGVVEALEDDSVLLDIFTPRRDDFLATQ